jgi:ABC-type transporter Mla maintaining outer membrane lipid asymmetry ATPase subunit MlaF
VIHRVETSPSSEEWREGGLRRCVTGQGCVKILGKVREGLVSDETEAARRLRVGMVFQSSALFDSLTVGENVGFLLYEKSNLPEARIQQLVAESLSMVGLQVGSPATIPHYTAQCYGRLGVYE